MMRPKKYNYFIGIDVSKNKLDYAVAKNGELLFHQERENSDEAVRLFVKELKDIPGFSIPKAVFCMEAIGLYANHLLAVLHKLKAAIVVENALHIRNSLGQIRGKNDKLDAIRISHYAFKSREFLRLWEPRRKIVDQLAHLSTLRTRMLATLKVLKNALNEQRDFIDQSFHAEHSELCQKSTAAVAEDLVDINRRIEQLIESDERLRRLRAIIVSVPCVGSVTAVQVIICTNEFRDITEPRKFACYAGVAPFPMESGVKKRRFRISHMANKKMKALLHMCALLSLRCDPEMRLYFDRKTGIEGKHGLVAMNAIRNKIIGRIFACLKQDRLFMKDHDKLKLADSLKTGYVE